MDFGLTEGDSGVVARATGFARQFSETGGTPSWDQWGDGGWTGLGLPGEFGGGGYPAQTSVLAFEALGRGGIDRGALFALGAHLFGCSMAVANHGSAEQKSAWLPLLASGTAVGALAFSEASGGSDLDSCGSKLVADGTGYRLSGAKTCVTNGSIADLFVVLARTREQRSPFAYSMVLLPRDTPGLSVTPIEGVRGLAATTPAEVVFDDCPVAESDLLRRGDLGMAQMLDIMRWERSCILAGSLGALQADFERVMRHLSERGRHQATDHALARIRTRIEAARWLMLQAAWRLDQSGSDLLQPSMSKLFVSEAIAECTGELRRLVAGAAWRGELGLADALDDALALLSASGTSEVQLNTIASQIGSGL